MWWITEWISFSDSDDMSLWRRQLPALWSRTSLCRRSKEREKAVAIQQFRRSVVIVRSASLTFSLLFASVPVWPTTMTITVSHQFSLAFVRIHYNNQRQWIFTHHTQSTEHTQGKSRINLGRVQNVYISLALSADKALCYCVLCCPLLFITTKKPDDNGGGTYPKLCNP